MHKTAKNQEYYIHGHIRPVADSADELDSPLPAG